MEVACNRFEATVHLISMQGLYLHVNNGPTVHIVFVYQAKSLSKNALARVTACRFTMVTTVQMWA